MNLQNVKKSINTEYLEVYLWIYWIFINLSLLNILFCFNLNLNLLFKIYLFIDLHKVKIQ